MATPVYRSDDMPMEATFVPSDLYPFSITSNIAATFPHATRYTKGSADRTDPGVLLTVKCGIPVNDPNSSARPGKTDDRDLVETGEVNTVLRTSETPQLFKQSGIVVQENDKRGFDPAVAALLERLACQEVNEQLDTASCLEDTIVKSDGLPPAVVDYVKLLTVFKGSSPNQRVLDSVVAYVAGTSRFAAYDAVQGMIGAGLGDEGPNTRSTKPRGYASWPTQIKKPAADGKSMVPVFDDQGRPRMTLMIRPVTVPHTASDRAAAVFLMKVLEFDVDDHFKEYSRMYLGTSSGTETFQNAPVLSMAHLANKRIPDDGAAANPNFMLTEGVLGQNVESSFGHRPNVTASATPGRPYEMGAIDNPFTPGVTLRAVLSRSYTSANVNFRISHSMRFSGSTGVYPMLEQWNNGMQIVPNGGYRTAVQCLPDAEARIHRDEDMLVATPHDLVRLGHTTKNDLVRARWIELLRCREKTHPLALRGIASQIMMTKERFDHFRNEYDHTSARFVPGQFYHTFSVYEFTSIRNALEDKHIKSLHDSRSLGIIINDVIADIYDTVSKKFSSAVLDTCLTFSSKHKFSEFFHDEGSIDWVALGSDEAGQINPFNRPRSIVHSKRAKDAIYPDRKETHETVVSEFSTTTKHRMDGIVSLLGLDKFFVLSRDDYKIESCKEFVKDLVQFVLAERCYFHVIHYATLSIIAAEDDVNAAVAKLTEPTVDILSDDDAQSITNTVTRAKVDSVLASLQDKISMEKSTISGLVSYKDMALTSLITSLVIAAKEEFIYDALAVPVPKEAAHGKRKPITHVDIRGLHSSALENAHWHLSWDYAPMTLGSRRELFKEANSASDDLPVVRALAETFLKDMKTKSLLKTPVDYHRELCLLSPAGISMFYHLVIRDGKTDSESDEFSDSNQGEDTFGIGRGSRRDGVRSTQVLSARASSTAGVREPDVAMMSTGSSYTMFDEAGDIAGPSSMFDDAHAGESAVDEPDFNSDRGDDGFEFFADDPSTVPSSGKKRKTPAPDGSGSKRSKAKKT